MPGSAADNGDAADLPPHVAVISTTDTAARAAIAAKLKLAAKIPVNKLLNGAGSSSSRRIGSNSNSNSNNNNSSNSSSNSRVSSAPKRIDTDRKLLHKSAEQWSAFEKTPPVAKLVPTARILPIRCPLSSLYEIHFAQHKVLTPSALMEKLIADSRSGAVGSIGTVIDATGGDAFLYDTKEWDDWDVDYVKLPVAVPDDADESMRHALDDALATAFCAAVETHKRGANSDMDVAVYGATGYSAIGFLIVSYLVEYCGMNLDAALLEYATAAPPGVYVQRHIEQLYRKYFSTLPSLSTRIACPAPPTWDTPTNSSGRTSKKSRNEGSVGAEILTDDDRAHPFVRTAGSVATGPSPSPSSSAPLTRPQATTPVGANKPTYTPPPPAYKPPLYIPPDRTDVNARPAKRRKIRSWMDDVPSLAFGETVDAASDEHANVTKALEALTGHAGFPGCETIPLTATHVADQAFNQKGCLTRNYLVTWRARGRRCLIYVSKYGTYVVSRDMTLTKVNMKFPRKRAPSEAQVNTLIDGLIVEDADQGTKVARYLAFDIVFLDGAPIWQKKLEKRLQCLQNEVILARKNDPSFDYSTEPFRVRMKDHFRLVKTEYLLQKFVTSVTHDVDGVIYTPTDAPYNLGGFESDAPIFKFVSSETGCGIPGLDGSISERRLLNYIHSIPQLK